MIKNELKPLIDKYMKKWIKKLRLGEFDYTIKFKNLTKSYAEVATDEETRHVTIIFNPRQLTTEQEVEHTVVHELLHVRINDYVELVEEIVRAHINNPKTRKLLERRLGRLEHKILVPITDAFSKKEK